MLCIHWLVQLMHCLYKALFMSNKTVYSFSYNTAILVVIIFVLSYAARTGAYASPRKFKKMVQFSEFGEYFAKLL